MLRQLPPSQRRVQVGDQEQLPAHSKGTGCKVYAAEGRPPCRARCIAVTGAVGLLLHCWRGSRRRGSPITGLVCTLHSNRSTGTGRIVLSVGWMIWLDCKARKSGGGGERRR